MWLLVYRSDVSGSTAERIGAPELSWAAWWFDRLHRLIVLGFAAVVISSYVAVPVMHFISFELVRGSPLR